MVDLTPEEQALCNACWDKQNYDIYLKVKDLPDDTRITYSLKTPDTNEVFVNLTMSVRVIKKIASEIEERKKK